MPSHPKVSILLPVFNGERYLKDSLESIFQQSYRDFELLAVNDGSTDRTRDILASYTFDPRLRIVELDHAGICGALNTGLRQARGEWVARIDSDDRMMPHRLERQLAYLESQPHLGGVGSYYEIIDETGAVRGSKEPPLRTLAELKAHLASGGRLIYPHPTMMFRRAIALAFDGYRAAFEKCEDVDLFLRMVEAGHPILIQPEYLTQFRYHAGSVSAASTLRQYHLNEIIFGNYRRRSHHQPEVTVEQYFASLDRLSPWRRWRIAAQVRSAVLMRRHDMARLRGRPFAGVLYLLAAAALNPGATIGKMRRLVQHARGRALGKSAELSS